MQSLACNYILNPLSKRVQFTAERLIAISALIKVQYVSVFTGTRSEGSCQVSLKVQYVSVFTGTRSEGSCEVSLKVQYVSVFTGTRSEDSCQVSLNHKCFFYVSCVVQQCGITCGVSGVDFVVSPW